MSSQATARANVYRKYQVYYGLARNSTVLFGRAAAPNRRSWGSSNLLSLARKVLHSGDPIV